MDRFVVISGCSGGGKSTLLAELARRGCAVVEEPGRRIVSEQLLSGGSALPWLDLAAFARRAIALALDDRAAARQHSGWVFFDRGLIDAVAALASAMATPLDRAFCDAHRYNRRVFLTPPWPEIYAGDAERRHDFSVALAEYDRLRDAYPALGYEVTILPKVSVSARADIVLGTLAEEGM
ncbi:AAA family ATPase [Ancylobacter sp. IITR112]|uniref:AAA family ATPase n=1 Tax=Ancylobacter sp. IITR112 TaxID=3138073 RepID=UPI00352B694C